MQFTHSFATQDLSEEIGRSLHICAQPISLIPLFATYQDFLQQWITVLVVHIEKCLCSSYLLPYIYQTDETTPLLSLQSREYNPEEEEGVDTLRRLSSVKLWGR